jgi:phenylacetate-CoA ligase
MPGGTLERIYYELPVWLQNGMLSLYGLQLARIRYNPHFFSLLSSLKESEWWSGERIRAQQDERIRDIVRHAYRTVPFYRRWYDQHGVDVERIASADDLQQLPVLTKQTVREHYHEMISSAFARGSLTTSLTSGTTGTPLTIWQTREGAAFQWAIWWRHKARFGLNLGDRHLVFGARVPVSQSQNGPPYWRHDRFNKRVYLSTYHISAATVAAIVDYLNSTHFEFFTGYPSAMYTLTTLMEEAGLRLTNRPKYVVAGADALTPAFEASIRRAFGVPVTEQYGMAEFAGNMSKCEQGMFHLDFECCHLEQQPIPGSENQYKLIFTGWGNPAMPFIRYEVGDVGSAATDACACGRASPCLARIDGRLEDFVVTPDGRRVVGMNQVLEYAPNARTIQVYQRSVDALELRVVAGSGFGDEDRQALVRELRRRVGPDMAIDIRLVDAFVLSPTGKFRAVISEVAQDAKGSA